MRHWKAVLICIFVLVLANFQARAQDTAYERIQIFTLADLHAFGPESLGVIQHIEKVAQKYPNDLILLFDLGDLVAANRVTIYEDHFGETTLRMFQFLLDQYPNVKMAGPIDNHAFDLSRDQGLHHLQRRVNLGPLLGTNIQHWRDAQIDLAVDEIIYFNFTERGDAVFQRSPTTTAMIGMLTPRLIDECSCLPGELPDPKPILAEFDRLANEGKFEGVKTLFIANHTGLGDATIEGDEALLMHVMQQLRRNKPELSSLKQIVFLTGHDHNIGPIARAAEGNHYVHTIPLYLGNGRRVTLRHMESRPYGEGLGQFTLKINAEGEITRFSRVVSHIPISPLEHVDATNPEATRQAAEYYNDVLRQIMPHLDEVVGHTPVPITGERSVVRRHPGAGVAGIPALAYREAALYHPEFIRFAEQFLEGPIDPDKLIGVYNGTGGRDTLQAGTITRNDLLRSLTFVYTAKTYLAQYKGSTLRALCEQAVELKRNGIKFWIQFAGLDFDVNMQDQFDGDSRIQAIRIWGQPLMDDAVYTLVLDSFYFKGGNEQPAFRDHLRFGTYGESPSLIEWFVRERLTKTPEESSLWIDRELEQFYSPELRDAFNRLQQEENLRFHMLRNMGPTDAELFTSHDAIVYDQGTHYHSQELSHVLRLMGVFHALEKHRTLQALKALLAEGTSLQDIPPFPLHGRWFEEQKAKLFGKKQNKAKAVLQTHEQRTTHLMGQIYRQAGSHDQLLQRFFPLSDPNRLLKWLARSNGGENASAIDSSWRIRFAPLVYAMLDLLGESKVRTSLPDLERARIGMCK